MRILNEAWNYIKNDCDQETGKEYSTVVQIIVKDDCGKALAWRSVSCNKTCDQVLDVKTVQIVSRHFLPGMQSILCTDRIGNAVFVRTSLKSGPKYWGSERNVSETILAARIDVWPGLYIEELPKTSTMIEQ